MTDKAEPVTATGSNFLRPGAVSNTRALVCYALGVAVGLVLGGISLFNAQGTSTNRVPPENLAVVNQRPILRSDFEAQLEAETGLPLEQTSREEQLRVLDEMIREELFVQRGLELDFAETDQETRYALYAIVESQILAGVTTGSATEAQLRAYYEANPAEFQSTGLLSVHHLIQRSGDLAQTQAAIGALQQGMSLSEASQRFNLEEAPYFPNDPYYLAPAHLGEELFAQVLTLEPGQFSMPVLADDGYHFAQLVQHQKPQQQSYAEAQREIQSKFYNSEKTRVMNNMMEFLRKRSTILIADDYREDYDPADFVNSY